jgi:hypothetical protein
MGSRILLLPPSEASGGWAEWPVWAHLPSDRLRLAPAIGLLDLLAKAVAVTGREAAGSDMTRSERSRAEQLCGQIREQPGEPGHVVAGVEDHQDGRVTLPPVPGGDQPGDDVADLRGGDLGLVITGARLQRRDDRVRPAGDHLRLPLPRPYTWQNSRSGLVTAPGRSQLLTSAASTSRPPAARGSGSPASDRRSRATSIRRGSTGWAARRGPASRWMRAFSAQPSSEPSGHLSMHWALR